jgi:hypothetical protein
MGMTERRQAWRREDLLAVRVLIDGSEEAFDADVRVRIQTIYGQAAEPPTPGGLPQSGA